MSNQPKAPLPFDHHSSYGYRHELPGLTKDEWLRGLRWRWNTEDVQSTFASERPTRGVMACYLAKVPFWHWMTRLVFGGYEKYQQANQPIRTREPVAGRRFRRMAAQGRRCVLIHLGDHDPSGIDMTRDNSLRVDLFSGEDVEIRRIALNMDQIEQYNPPPNPAKLTDKRAEGYIARFGSSSWELDALEPRVIDELVSAELDSLIDPEVWNETAGEEGDRREVLSKFHTYFHDISDFISRMEAGEED